MQDFWTQSFDSAKCSNNDSIYIQADVTSKNYVATMIVLEGCNGFEGNATCQDYKYLDGWRENPKLYLQLEYEQVDV